MQVETDDTSPKSPEDFRRPLGLIFSAFALFLTVIVAAGSGALLAQRSYAPFYVLSGIAGLLALVGVVFLVVAEYTKRGRLIFSLVYLLLVFPASAAAWFWSYRASSREDYIVLRSISTNVVRDVEGRTGYFTLVQEIRALRGGVASLKIRNLGATGEIKNIKVAVAGRGYDLRVENLAGLWQEETRLLPPLRKGETVTKTLELAVVEGKPEPKVYSIAKVSRTTEYLEMNLVVPRERPCKSVEAWSTNGDKIGEAQPQLAADNTRVTWHRTQPQKGREYTVSCNW